MCNQNDNSQHHNLGGNHQPTIVNSRYQVDSQNTQTYPLNLFTKYTNTHTPNENYTQTDMILQ